MSQPDNRGGHPERYTVGGSDPDFPGDEDYYTITRGGHKAWHIQADVKVTFTPATTNPTNYHVQADVVSEFKARESDDS